MVASAETTDLALSSFNLETFIVEKQVQIGKQPAILNTQGTLIHCLNFRNKNLFQTK
jgi:hypothetical protein